MTWLFTSVGQLHLYDSNGIGLQKEKISTSITRFHMTEMVLDFGISRPLPALCQHEPTYSDKQPTCL
jgi:hypothetical protein